FLGNGGVPAGCRLRLEGRPATVNRVFTRWKHRRRWVGRRAGGCLGCGPVSGPLNWARCSAVETRLRRALRRVSPATPRRSPGWCLPCPRSCTPPSFSPCPPAPALLYTDTGGASRSSAPRPTTEGLFFLPIVKKFTNLDTSEAGHGFQPDDLLPNLH